MLHFTIHVCTSTDEIGGWLLQECCAGLCTSVKFCTHSMSGTFYLPVRTTDLRTSVLRTSSFGALYSVDITGVCWRQKEQKGSKEKEFFILFWSLAWGFTRPEPWPFAFTWWHFVALKAGVSWELEMWRRLKVQRVLVPANATVAAQMDCSVSMGTEWLLCMCASSDFWLWNWLWNWLNMTTRFGSIHGGWWQLSAHARRWLSPPRNPRHLTDTCGWFWFLRYDCQCTRSTVVLYSFAGVKDLVRVGYACDIWFFTGAWRSTVVNHRHPWWQRWQQKVNIKMFSITSHLISGRCYPSNLLLGAVSPKRTSINTRLGRIMNDMVDVWNCIVWQQWARGWEE